MLVLGSGLNYMSPPHLFPFNIHTYSIRTMVLNFFRLINFSLSTVKVVSNKNPNDNFIVDPNNENGHDMWISSNDAQGVEVCVFFGPMEKGCGSLLWDQNWSL